MNDSSNSINDYAFSEHEEAFSVLLSVFKRLGIRFFLIGAQARDFHFIKNGITPPRRTEDFDFAVMVKNNDEYKTLLRKLEIRGFSKTKLIHRLIWSNGQTIIDLVPFGGIAKNGTIDFGELHVELTVLGYKELQREAKSYAINAERTLSVSVPPLHGIFLLKLLSWNEQKPSREQDLKDIFQITQNYWKIVETEAYEAHTDLFELDDFSIEKAGARILGRHLARTIQESNKLKTLIIQVLEREGETLDKPGQMLRVFSNEGGLDLEHSKMIINEILQGIRDE
ncbi:MAG: hypothetical protein AB8F95_05810 [Bacteroidia bacterium]